MKKYLAFLIALISSLTITGISVIDGKIWDIIFVVIGMISYAIVGVLFSVGILTTRRDGSEARALITILIIAVGFGVYQILVRIRSWILSWPVAVKIIVPCIVGLVIIVAIVITTIRFIRNSKVKKHNGKKQKTKRVRVS